MHIAKTAGTSVNEYFADMFGTENVLVHAEGKRNIFNIIGSGDHKHLVFVSGHLRLPNFLRLIDLREWFLFTCVRNPIDHVVSHLQWVKAIGHPENARFRDTHHEDIKRLATDLYKTPLDDVATLNEIIYKKHPIALQLFNNCQTRYFIPEVKRPLNLSDLRYAMNSAICFDFVARSESVEADIKTIASRLNLQSSRGNLNHSNRRKIVERPNFNNLDILAFYRRLVSIDQLLYDFLTTKDISQ